MENVTEVLLRICITNYAQNVFCKNKYMFSFTPLHFYILIPTITLSHIGFRPIVNT